MRRFVRRIRGAMLVVSLLPGLGGCSPFDFLVGAGSSSSHSDAPDKSTWKYLGMCFQYPAVDGAGPYVVMGGTERQSIIYCGNKMFTATCPAYHVGIIRSGAGPSPFVRGDIVVKDGLRHHFRGRTAIALFHGCADKRRMPPIIREKNR